MPEIDMNSLDEPIRELVKFYLTLDPEGRKRFRHYMEELPSKPGSMFYEDPSMEGAAA